MQNDESIDHGDKDAQQEKRRKYIKYGIFGGIGVIILTLAIVLPLTLKKKPPGPSPPTPPPPKPVISAGQNPYYVLVDTEKNTAWSRTGLIEFDVNRTVNSLVENLIPEETKRIFLGDVAQQTVQQIGVNWTASLLTGPNNNIKKKLRYTFDMIDFKVARFELTDSDSDRFAIPDEIVERPEANKNMRLDMVGHFFNGTTKNNDQPFGFRFFDNVKPDSLYISTEDQSLIFSDKYIQMDFALPTNQVTGFGERITSHRLGDGAWGMWGSGTTDEDMTDNARGRGGKHGVHPFLLVRSTQAQKYIGMYFRNANAQLPIIRQDPQTKKTTLSYITLGGQIEVYFFISGTAKEVIQDYQRIFGKPQLPPFWAMGWHQASQTHYNVTEEKDRQLDLEQTIANYRVAGLPLDAIYLDAKHMSKKSNFQIDESVITNATELRLALNASNVKLVAYIEPTVFAPENIELENPTYTVGNEKHLFIKSTHFSSVKYSNNLVASKNLQKCVYVDWFRQEDAYPFWFNSLQAFHKIIDFDGVWTTQNEAYSDVQGEIDNEPKPKTARHLESAVGETQFDTTWFTTFNSSKESTYELPFLPEYKTRGSYDVNSISLNATHTNFTFYNSRTRQIEKKNESQYNLHSLYGHGMISTTHRALNDLANFDNTLKNKRPFVITRSTFTGTNQYASYPIHYRYRTWTSLKQSISHVMSMNMFGFTHTGVDACGTIDYPGANRIDMDEELCLRWIQLATFFPLARHSQTLNSNNQYLTNPLAFKDPAKKSALWKTMRDRMQYLRFMYTCLFEAHEWGGSCFDPIYFHHTLDVSSMEDVTGTNSTFIFGGAVKVSPVVDHIPENTTTFKSHFPKGRWLNLANMKVVEAKADGEQDLDATQETVNVHLRPGSIIPMQDLVSENITIQSTVQLLEMPITIVINRNERKAASGKVFLDDGSTKSELLDKSYEYYSIDHKASKTIQFSLAQGKRGGQDQRHHLDKIIIGDAEDLNETNFACAQTQMNEIIFMQREYFAENKTLKLYRPRNFDERGVVFSNIQNIFYGNSATDLDLCNITHFQYKIAEGTDVEKLLLQPSASMTLVHKGGVLPDINFTVRMFDEGIINVHWTWQNATTNGKRAHPPVPDLLVDTSRATPQGQAVGRHLIVQSDPFLIKFAVQQGQTEPLFEIDRFVYDSYFNWVSMTALSTFRDDNHRGVIGLGERSSNSLFYKDGIYSMWAYDDVTKNDDGTLPGKNGYGVHPFFMFQHSPEKWVGVFSKQAHAQDWIIRNYPQDGKTELKQISTGGQSDFYIIINSNNPDSVIGYYQRIVGKPVLMPQWTLGWHQCKYCLRSVSEYREVVDNYAKYNIPLDAQWGDIDYMNNYQNFKVDYLHFGDLKSYVDDLYHFNNDTKRTKFVPIVDAGIAVRQKYSTYQNGENQKVFLKSKNDGGQTLVAQVWPNQAAIPDFFAENSTKWWHSELTEFRDNHVHFDGLWLDMNEAANFCKGACLERQRTAESMADMFYYTPTGRSLESKSLPIDVEHANSMYTQLDTHNYFGAHQTAVTHNWFKTHSDKRPFIISRSTFAGTGKFAGKWLGDSGTSFDDMQRSVTGSMMMNMFGIPFVGGDICGFTGHRTTPHLCARWHQVGAFQPFSRNHRDCDGAPQEPYRFINDTIMNGTVSITDLMRKSIYEKYSLIRYYYTHLFLLSQDNSTNGAFYKPVFFEFPNLAGAYRANPSENIMLGPSLKLSIKTSPNVNWDSEKNPYFFPQGKWCDILHPEAACVVSNGDETQILDAGLKDYQLHLRDGHIVPFQNASHLNISRSEHLQAHPVDFHINPANKTRTNRTVLYSASGVYVNDNGTALNQVGTYNKYQISYQYQGIVQANNSVEESIVIRVSTKDLATEYYSNETRCAKINQNDILGSIIIHDEFRILQRDVYVVMILRPDGTYDFIGVANYDRFTGNVVYTGQDRPPETPEVCLSNVEEIVFRPPIA